MERRFVFVDEAGCFTFSHGPNVSRYFILCTVTMNDCRDIASDLLDLRRNIAWSNDRLGEYFHATTDAQVTRDQVFTVLQKHDFSVQATIMEKSKAHPDIRAIRSTFYRYGFFYHFKHGMTEQLPPSVEALVTTATIGTRREQAAFSRAVDEALAQTLGPGRCKTHFAPASADSCLQVADYCAWAIQRKWERDDLRSYDIIKSRITYEYDLWLSGSHHFY